MSDIRVTMQVKYSNGDNGAGLHVRVHEVGGATYDVGDTDSDGNIDAVVRQRRQIVVFGRSVDDPTDHPTLDVSISDDSGDSIWTPPLPLLILPPNFDSRNESPTDPAPAPGSPSALADAAIQPLVAANAPGYVMLVRKNGVEWANATRGLSRVHMGNQFSRAMTNDTILNIASMSKPITATAVVAMIDDWTFIRNEVHAIGSAGAPTTLVLLMSSLGSSFPPSPPRIVEAYVPTVLLPLFGDRAEAAAFLSSGLATPAAVRDALDDFANRGAKVMTPVTSPPGYFGLLRRVVAGVAVPKYTDPFLPLIQARLGAGAPIAPNVPAIQIADLLTHHTTFDHDLNPASHTPAEMAAVTTSEPPGGVATNNYWEFVKLLVSEPADRFAGIKYHNNNYTVLTTVIEACTETTFDDYVTRRLFSDLRYSDVRRRVVTPDRGALYYEGTSPNWTGGGLLSDYTKWPGNGGFYVTANQLTDWLYALFTGQAVAGPYGNKPMISSTGLLNLFGTEAFFSLGIATRPGPAAASVRYQHNGGTTVNGGSVNGNLAIVAAPSGAVYTAFFDANGSLGADPPFDAVVASLPW